MDYSDFFQHLPIIGRFSIIFGLIVILPKIAERFRLPGVVGLIAGFIGVQNYQRVLASDYTSLKNS